MPNRTSKADREALAAGLMAYFLGLPRRSDNDIAPTQVKLTPAERTKVRIAARLEDYPSMQAFIRDVLMKAVDAALPANVSERVDDAFSSAST